LNHYVMQVRDETSDVLLLDAGDLMTGNIISNIEYKDAEGGALVEMMNMIGYDGMTCGNHEFDKHKSNLEQLIAIAEFPVFSANLLDDKGESFTEEKYHIYNVSGLKVGVIGLTPHPLKGLVNPHNLDEYNTYDPAEAVNNTVEKIDPATDLIIVLSHLGINADRELAGKVNNVDIIVGGHSHTKLEEPELVNGIIILQAGAYSHYLGRLDLTVSGDSVMEFSGSLIPTFSDSIEIDTKLADFVDSFEQIINQEYGRVIGHLTSDWIPEILQESNIGNWLTDAMRLRTKTDVGFINSGAIRKSLQAGPIAVKDIMEIIPFLDYVEIFECTGEQLMTIIYNNAKAQADQSRGVLQVSGIEYSWKTDNGDVNIVKATVGGKPLDVKKTYKVSSLDYVIFNHQQYFGFNPENVISNNILIHDLLIEAVEEADKIDSRIEHRINKAG